MQDLTVVRDPHTGAYDVRTDGGYPLCYYTRDGLTICATCASREIDDAQAVVGYDIHYEGDPIVCEDCDAEIPSAYGPIDTPTT